MARTLNVFYHREPVGQLIQDDDGQMSFRYDESWLGRLEPIALSRSLPLRAEHFTQKECRGFFGGILPEEDSRNVIARILGISNKNDFAMLEQIGGECAGATSFLPTDETMPEDDDNYRGLANDELAKSLRELPRRPLMAGEDDIRLSLAGAQDKIAVRIEDGEIAIPRGSAPSSHVLKPAIDTYEGVVFNEAFCMTLASACGLDAAPVSIGKIEDIDYLLVQRYDRVKDDTGKLQRLHQEDFCQALGIPSQIKYQSEGGPSLLDCFNLIRDVSTAPARDLIALLDAVIFNLLIGNHDAHAKNFALLYGPDRSIRLAPLYDLVCTAYYTELTEKMAMKIGGEARSRLIYPAQVERFAARAGLGVALARERVLAMANRLLAQIRGIELKDPVTAAVAALIVARCNGYRSRFGKEKR